MKAGASGARSGSNGGANGGGRNHSSNGNRGGDNGGDGSGNKGRADGWFERLDRMIFQSIVTMRLTVYYGGFTLFDLARNLVKFMLGFESDRDILVMIQESVKNLK